MINLKKKREIDFKKTNLGKKIIFCEGSTEYNYFEYFKIKLDKLNNKYASLEIEPINVNGGGAISIYKQAIKFLDAPENKKFHLYEKILIFDLDDPKDSTKMKEVLLKIKNSDYNFVSLYSYKTFEVWLLMHLIDVYTSLSKAKLKEELRKNLSLQRYVKNSKGIIAKILHDDNQINKAIANGKKLEDNYLKDGKEVLLDYKSMNPYTLVYKLVEEILDALT